MENIVNSLFADYLPRRQQESVGIADPRQQTMLTNQMLTPVMEKPVKPSQEAPVFPSVGGIGGGVIPTQPQAAPVSDQTLTPVMPKPTAPTEEAPEFASVGGIGGGVVPTAEEEEETTEPVAYGFGNFNSDALADINLDNIGLVDLGNFQGGDFVDPFEGLSIKERLSVNQDAWVDVFNSYSDFLGSVESGNTTNKVNLRDDIYNNYFNENKAADRYLGDPAKLRAAVGLSDAFSVYDKAGSTITGESLQGAYQALTSGANPVEALSAYYGFEIQPTSNEGANYTNAAKYGTDAQRMAEFQSLVEPILQKSIPYIQATQGLSYTDALEYAYTHDPMLAAVYQSYGVDLFRQTKDGSTYIYDPIAGQEIRTLEVKDARFKDVFPSLVKAGIIAVATGGIGAGLGGALGLTAGQTSALTGALGSLAQGGDPKDAILAAVTGGVSGGLTDAIGSALGVSKEIATGITQAGLAAAQGAGSEEALLSGFLAGVGEYIRGETPAANQDPDQFGFKGENPDIPFDGADAATGSAEAWSAAFAGTETAKAATDAIKTAATQNPAATMGETLVIAQRNNPNIAADALKSAAQQVASGAVTPEEGMLTKDTPAGELEEVTVTGRMSNLGGREVYVATNGQILDANTLLPIDKRRVEGKDGVIRFIDEDTEMLNDYGSSFAEGFQRVHGPDRWLELLNGILAGEEYTVFGNDITYDKLFGDDPSRKVADVTLEETQPEQPEGASLPDKPTDEDLEPQPALPAEEPMEIPEFDIENLPPDFNAEIPEVVTPPVTPETPVVPRPTTGGGGGSAGGIVIPPPPAPSTPATPEAPTDEVVDVFDDGGLTGDAFDDSTTGGAEGGAAEEGGAEGSEGAEGGAAEVGGDAGDVDVTTTEEYKALQGELDNALASQDGLKIEVGNLQNEVAAANAAAKQAQEAAAAAEAAGAANADKLRGEAVAAQEAANKTQSELDSANKALGNADSTIKDLTSKLGASETANVELTKELEKTNTEVATLEGKLSTVKETNTDLTKRLEDSNTKVGELNKNLSSAKEDLASLKDEYAEAVVSNKKNVDSLEKKVKSKESEIKGLEKNIKDADSTVKSLEGEINKNKKEITGLEGSLSDALKTISGLESSLADAQAATDAAVAKGIADAAGAGKEGLGKGLGAGAGLGSAIGLLGGFGMGQAQGGGGVPYTRPEAKDFMAKLNFNLPEAERLQQQQLTDYVGMLLGNMR